MRVRKICTSLAVCSKALIERRSDEVTFSKCAINLALGIIATVVAISVIASQRTEASVLRLAKRFAVGAALVGLAVLALRFGIRAARISGVGLEGATDPMMLGSVWESPLGTAAIWRTSGEVGILALLIPRLGQWIALAGSLAVVISFAQVG